MTIYMKVTRDKYRLPVAVADSPKELAALCGVSPNAIYSGFSHEKREERRLEKPLCEGGCG